MPADWSQCDEPPKLESGTVHVWRLDLQTSKRAAQFLSYLTADERVYADGLQESQREKFICSRGGIRLLLGRYHRQEPESVIFHTTETGKPYIEGGVEFNISHSHDRVLFALAKDMPVGIDVEYCYRERVSYKKLAQRFFLPSEAKYIRGAGEGELPRVFFQIWTIKEAAVKALGLGISRGFRRCEVTFLPKQEEPALLIDGRASYFYTLPLDNNYTGALVAATDTTPHIQLYRL